MKPRLLDTFCKAGGAGMGYHRAGFEVVGVDHEPQKRYPFAFVEADALDFLRGLIAGASVCGYYLSDFDVIHASPPCQEFSALRHRTGRRYADLVAATRDLLEKTGRPWVIENVPGAPLRSPVIVCGSSLLLKTTSKVRGEVWLKRHRWFESSLMLLAPPCGCARGRKVIGVYGNGDGGGRGWKGTMADRRAVMGIDWMTRDELSQAIPPAYTEYIGRQLLAALAWKESP